MSTSQPVEAFIFDFFGVLAEYDETILHRRLAPFCTDPETALANMENLGSDRDVIIGVATMATMRDRVVESFGLTMSLEDFERAWCEAYSWPMPGMDDLVRELSQRYRLVLLSNIDGYYWDNVYGDYDLLKAFDTVLLSYQMGIAKPDEEAYRLAAKAAGCEMSRCFFIDDRPGNTEAAAGLGLQTHTFRSTDDLRAELTRRGLL